MKRRMLTRVKLQVEYAGKSYRLEGVIDKKLEEGGRLDLFKVTESRGD
jgi:hypothetical protein